MMSVDQIKQQTLTMRLKSKKEFGMKQPICIASPCAACKLLRRRCTQDCIFAPYFPAEEPHKFVIVHKVFGASNVSKLLQEIAVQQRSDAASSLVYEAKARIRDPVYGCVAAIAALQSQIHSLQGQLAVTQAQMLHLRLSHDAHIARLAERSQQARSGCSNGDGGGSNGKLSSPSGMTTLLKHQHQFIEDEFKLVSNQEMFVQLGQTNVNELPIWSY